MKAYVIPSSRFLELSPLLRASSEVEVLQRKRDRLIEQHHRALIELDAQLEKAKYAARTLRQFRFPK